MGATWRIAVVADTHDRLPPTLLEAVRSADEIWHLGDVCEPSTLDQIRALGPPVQVVRGNQDSCWDWPMSLDLQRKDQTFHLRHIPPASAPLGVKFLLHGHTHVPRDQTIGETRFLNPGAAGLANKGAPRSFGWLLVTERREPVFRLAPVPSN